MPPTFPALKGSKIATGPIEDHVNIVFNGKSGTAMQAFKNQLSDVELHRLLLMSEMHLVIIRVQWCSRFKSKRCVMAKDVHWRLKRCANQRQRQKLRHQRQRLRQQQRSDNACSSTDATAASNCSDTSCTCCSSHPCCNSTCRCTPQHLQQMI